MDTLQETIDCLSASHLLKYAPQSLISELAPRIIRVDVEAGEQLINKGDSGDTMYIVATGAVRVHDKDVVLKTLGPSDLFGEIRALTSDVSTASITAIEDSCLLKISQEDFYHALNEYPQASKAVIKALVEKERGVIKDVAEHAVKINVFEKELEIGRKIQSSFLPDVIPEAKGWDIDGRLDPAREVSGDFYDFFKINSLDSLGVVIGDVCDKGIGAALFVSLFRSLIRFTSLSEDFTGWSETTAVDWSEWGEEHLAEDNIENNLRNSITYANNYISTTHRKSSMFASVFFALVNLKTGKLSYINAGHEAPVLFGKDGRITRLEPTGPVIGLFPDIHFEVKHTTIKPGEALFAFTDGLPEAKNIEAALFGDEKLVELGAGLFNNKRKLINGVFDKLNEYIGNAVQFDDMTGISVSRDD